MFFSRKSRSVLMFSLRGIVKKQQMIDLTIAWHFVMSLLQWSDLGLCHLLVINQHCSAHLLLSRKVKYTAGHLACTCKTICVLPMPWIQVCLTSVCSFLGLLLWTILSAFVSVLSLIIGLLSLLMPSLVCYPCLCQWPICLPCLEPETCLVSVCARSSLQSVFAIVWFLLVCVLFA